MISTSVIQSRRHKHYLWIYMLLSTSLGFTPEQAQPHDEPTMISTQLQITGSTQGIVKFRLFTDKALQYANGDRVYPEGVRVEFLEDDKTVAAIGRANAVYFFAEKNVYEFRGDVELKSLREEKQLNTEELHWNPETETIHTEKFIRIETEDQVLTGEGLSAHQDLSDYYIAKPQGLSNINAVK